MFLLLLLLFLAIYNLYMWIIRNLGSFTVECCYSRRSDRSNRSAVNHEILLFCQCARHFYAYILVKWYDAHTFRGRERSAAAVHRENRMFTKLYDDRSGSDDDDATLLRPLNQKSQIILLKWYLFKHGLEIAKLIEWINAQKSVAKSIFSMKNVFFFRKLISFK